MSSRSSIVPASGDPFTVTLAVGSEERFHLELESSKHGELPVAGVSVRDPHTIVLINAVAPEGECSNFVSDHIGGVISHEMLHGLFVLWDDREACAGIDSEWFAARMAGL